MRHLLLLLLCIISINIYADSIENKVDSTLITTSKYVEIGKGIGTAVNETLKSVEDSAMRIADSRVGKIATGIVVWKLLYKEITGAIIGIILLGLSIYLILASRGRFDDPKKEGSAIFSMTAAIILFTASMICLF